MKRPKLPTLDAGAKVNALWSAGVGLLAAGVALEVSLGAGLALAGALLIATAVIFAKGVAVKDGP